MQALRRVSQGSNGPKSGVSRVKGPHQRQSHLESGCITRRPLGHELPDRQPSGTWEVTESPFTLHVPLSMGQSVVPEAPRASVCPAALGSVLLCTRARVWGTQGPQGAGQHAVTAGAGGQGDEQESWAETPHSTTPPTKPACFTETIFHSQGCLHYQVASLLLHSSNKQVIF